MNPSQPETPVAGVEPSLSEHPIIDKALSGFADEVIAKLTSRVAELEQERDEARRLQFEWAESSDSYSKECASLRAELQSAKEHCNWLLDQVNSGRAMLNATSCDEMLPDAIRRTQAAANAEIERLRRALEAANLPDYPEGPTMP